MNKQKLEERRKAREELKEIARIEAEKNQRPVKSIIITIEWAKSKMWGSNPRCQAEVEYKESDRLNGKFERSPIFRCSGCGYDKESTVIADVFNKYLKYKLYKLSDTTNLPYGIYLGKEKFYNGGIGTNCYYKISEAIGGKFEHIARGRTFDVYKYIDNE